VGGFSIERKASHGVRPLFPGRWLLVVGRWLLIVGCWQLYYDILVDKIRLLPDPLRPFNCLSRESVAFSAKLTNKLEAL
jgi:hypothetical protein